MWVEEEVETGPTVTIIEECPDDDDDDDDDDDSEDEYEYENVVVVSTDDKKKVVKKVKRKRPKVKGIAEVKASSSANETSLKIGGWFGNKQSSDDNTCKILSGWRCPRFGKYPHPIDCQKYVRCTFQRENTVYQCPEEQAYDLSSNDCSMDWSSCEALNECLYDHELLEDPSDDQNYFICIKRQQIFKRTKFSAYRRRCADGRTFDIDYQRCVTDEQLYLTNALNPNRRPTKPHSSHNKKKKSDKKKKGDKKKKTDKNKKKKKKSDKKKKTDKKQKKKKSDKKKTSSNNKKGHSKSWAFITDKSINTLGNINELPSSPENIRT